ncbi:MAG TPA: hypothetical protein VIG33_15915 [Pseudobdellovibrionaceae bacterium]
MNKNPIEFVVIVQDLISRRPFFGISGLGLVNWKGKAMMARVLWFIFPLAITYALKAPCAPPKNQALLGAATYITMPLRKLSHPTLVYVNKEYLQARGISLDQVLEKFGFASPVDGEFADVYLDNVKTAYVDGNGGIGLNENFGSGRAAIVDEEWQIKGSGRTPMVNPNTDAYHRNGASFLPEAIHEAIWGNLLAEELPFGAYRVVAIIATGSMVASGEQEPQPRFLIVREDPLRPGHFVINPTSEKMNDPRDRARVQEAMKHLVEALPQPAGPVPKSEVARFRSGIFEFIDRQAIQHAYAWTHSLFHGGTSPTNAALDGRMLDFGTYSAFDGYPRVRILDDDGFMGDTEVYKRDLLKDIRDSWLKTLPSHLLANLPSEKEWFERFETVFQKTKKTEILRLAGALSEFKEELLKTQAGQNLAKTLLELAMAGNEKGIEAWRGEEPFGQGRYNLGKILVAASSVNLQDFDAENKTLRTLIPEEADRKTFVDHYQAFFKLQRDLVLPLGINPEAEATYRKYSSQIRNKKMVTLFHKVDNEKHIWKILEDYQKDHDPRPTQKYIDAMISQNRREFPAAPYTIVLKETKSGEKIERDIFDARTNQFMKTQIQSQYGQGGAHFRCEAVFLLK